MLTKQFNMTDTKATRPDTPWRWVVRKVHGTWMYVKLYEAQPSPKPSITVRSTGKRSKIEAWQGKQYNGD